MSRTIPLINRFTCLPRQLPMFINNVKDRQMLPIIDNICEDGKYSERNFNVVKDTVNEYPMNMFAIKLSSLNIRDENNDNNLLIDRVFDIAETVRENDSKLIIDAEEYEINDKVDEISDMIMGEFNKDDVMVYKTYQMYRRDTMTKYLKDLKKDREYKLGCKVVRGAYYNQDLVNNILFWKIEDTHKNYDDSIRYFVHNFQQGDELICATHNHKSNDLAKQFIHQGMKNIKIGHLMGMSDYLSEDLVDEGITVYKYLPFGEYQDTLPYLSRRLYENYPILGHMI